MADTKKEATQQEKLATAPLPQKNAESPPVGEHAHHEDRLLDDALESTFPASDPVVETPVKCTPEQEAVLAVEDEIVEHGEFLLDEALEMTFPASDPIAVPDLGTISKSVSHLDHSQQQG